MFHGPQWQRANSGIDDVNEYSRSVDKCRYTLMKAIRGVLCLRMTHCTVVKKLFQHAVEESSRCLHKAKSSALPVNAQLLCWLDHQILLSKLSRHTLPLSSLKYHVLAMSLVHSRVGKQWFLLEVVVGFKL